MHAFHNFDRIEPVCAARKGVPKLMKTGQNKIASYNPHRDKEHKSKLNRTKFELQISYISILHENQLPRTSGSYIHPTSTEGTKQPATTSPLQQLPEHMKAIGLPIEPNHIGRPLT